MVLYLVDEHNGFRKKHVSISTIIRTRINEGKCTFACFVDFQKAFEWIHRDLLAFKFMEAGPDGRVYNAIEALYSYPVACVEINHTFCKTR